MRRASPTLVPLGLILLGCAHGCRYGARTGAEPRTLTFTTSEAQIAHGAKVYANSCASCHGDAGQGSSEAHTLVGETAFSEFRTAMDVAVFATENMPPNKRDRDRLAPHDY